MRVCGFKAEDNGFDLCAENLVPSCEAGHPLFVKRSHSDINKVIDNEVPMKLNVFNQRSSSAF